ncbi:ATP-grasp domain-containing protein [Paenibacillus jiagnxiensis]|uniref:ATP-grasp domain-containing protein n=1 Tax=Paenibacillus jiagnxiensis TaxID=3228926 RepID=UPI0033AFCFC4
MTIRDGAAQAPLNILITGGRAPAALELARLLHHAGHRVYAAESTASHLCRVSSAVERSFRLPPPRQQPQRFLEELEALIVRLRIDLLIPTCEEIFYIARGLDRLRGHCRVLSPDLSQLRQLHHKGEFIELARRLGFKVPHTELITSAEEWEAAGEPGNFSSGSKVFKPAYSRFASRVIMPDRFGRDTSAGRSRPVPVPVLQITPAAPWVAQEFIQGKALCTYSVVHDGRVVAHAAYESRYRTGKIGASVYFKHVDHALAYDWVTRFTSSLRFSGQISFDFIEALDGTLYPIECNPRATSGIHLFAAGGGLELALAAPDRLVRAKRTVTPHDGSAAMITLAMLGCGLRRNRSRQDWAAWLGSLRGARDVIWRYDDPRPFLEQAWIVCSAWRLSRQLGITMTEALTQDIEWNGET